MKILHFSDLHLDTPFSWAPRDVARHWRQGLRNALSRILALAAEERVDAVFCGGDLYEHDRCSPDTAEFLRASFAEIDPIRVFLAPGNHDWLGPASIYGTTRWSPNVHLFRWSRLEAVALDGGLTLWGAAHERPAGTMNLLDGFRVDRGGIHLGLFHASERGWLASQGQGKHPHAPFDEAEIEMSGLHHAFLGHYHRSREAPRYTYPGNPCPLSFGEEGPRGPVVATIGSDGTVNRVWHDVGQVRVHDITVDVTGCASSEDLRRKVAAALDGHSGVARVTVRGELEPDVPLDLAALAEAAPWLDFVLSRVGDLRLGYDLSQIRGEPTVRGAFVRGVLGANLDESTRRKVLVTGLRALGGREDLEVT